MVSTWTDRHPNQLTSRLSPLNYNHLDYFLFILIIWTIEHTSSICDKKVKHFPIYAISDLLSNPLIIGKLTIHGLILWNFIWSLIGTYPVVMMTISASQKIKCLDFAFMNKYDIFYKWGAVSNCTWDSCTRQSNS